MSTPEASVEATAAPVRPRVLAVEDLSKAYRGRRVVDGVAIEIRSGEVVGLLGPNGAGKTTTFYMVVGLEKPDAGRILLDGEEVSALPMYRRARLGINYLPQEQSIFRKLTVEENVLAILENLPLGAAERGERLEQLLDELGITKLRTTQAQLLSGGEKRRLEIARALVTDPTFMLLDEPFAGIDPIATLDIQGIIADLTKRGIGVLITDHNVRETLKICDRAYILHQGRVIKAGTPAEIIADAKAREVYLGESFRL
ncbi:MAG: LPS export ABC transporter ATP-binding protein [Deltaproteobacteria bacterium]|nr:LPS export ABC transporter ATP-binding protein [Deltaproteobacteria bacterium]